MKLASVTNMGPQRAVVFDRLGTPHYLDASGKPVPIAGVAVARFAVASPHGSTYYSDMVLSEAGINSVDCGSVFQSDTDADADFDTDIDTDIDIDTDADTDIDSDTDIDADTDIDSDADFDTDIDSDTDTDSDSDTDTDSDSDSDTDTDRSSCCIAPDLATRYGLPCDGACSYYYNGDGPFPNGCNADARYCSGAGGCHEGCEAVADCSTCPTGFCIPDDAGTGKCCCIVDSDTDTDTDECGPGICLQGAACMSVADCGAAGGTNFGPCVHPGGCQSTDICCQIGGSDTDSDTDMDCCAATIAINHGCLTLVQVGQCCNPGQYVFGRGYVCPSGQIEWGYCQNPDGSGNVCCGPPVVAYTRVTRTCNPDGSSDVHLEKSAGNWYGDECCGECTADGHCEPGQTSTSGNLDCCGHDEGAAFIPCPTDCLVMGDTDTDTDTDKGGPCDGASGNGVCDPSCGEDCNNTPGDCACGPSQVCRPIAGGGGYSCQILSSCGNGSCEWKTTDECDTCWEDCGTDPNTYPCNCRDDVDDGNCDPRCGENCNDNPAECPCTPPNARCGIPPGGGTYQCLSSCDGDGVCEPGQGETCCCHPDCNCPPGEACLVGSGTPTCGPGPGSVC